MWFHGRRALLGCVPMAHGPVVIYQYVCHIMFDSVSCTETLNSKRGLQRGPLNYENLLSYDALFRTTEHAANGSIRAFVRARVTKNFGRVSHVTRKSELTRRAPRLLVYERTDSTVVAIFGWSKTSGRNSAQFWAVIKAPYSIHMGTGWRSMQIKHFNCHFQLHVVVIFREIEPSWSSHRWFSIMWNVRFAMFCSLKQLAKEPRYFEKKMLQMDLDWLAHLQTHDMWMLAVLEQVILMLHTLVSRMLSLSVGVIVIVVAVVVTSTPSKESNLYNLFSA